MKEANLQTLFGKYLTEHPPSTTEVYELKICKGPSLPFDAVKDHQIKGLLEAQNGLYHKITDFPMFAGSKSRFNRPKPFDCICFNNVIGYVVILFYQPRKKKIVYKTSVKNFLHLKETSSRKSCTEKMIAEISEAIEI
jgi:hypothetical protein